jgi:Cu(I)/Ag(I) efflux system protein CusF
MKKLLLTFLLAAAAAAIAPSLAADDMADAEVRKVDREAAKLTLKHGDIKNLDMPAMTMVFGVRDKALLDKVKAGDKVLFKAEKEGSSFFVTEVEAAK